MKDAYSFHTTDESLDEAYQDMNRAYRRIFEACHLDYTVVEADSGDIGGSASNEFMVVAESGEDAVVRSSGGDYAANVEKATAGPLEAPPAEEQAALAEVPTPGATTIEEVAAMLEVEPARMVKTLLYESDDEVVAVVVRGDREVNEIKLLNLLGANAVVLAGEDVVTAKTGAPVGFAGPIGLPEDLRLIADESVRGLTNFVCGANKADAHYTGANWGRDADPSEWADLLLVKGGDPSPVGDGELEEFRGIEVGHIFKLGCKYSEAMSCTYTDEQGQDHPMVMGCYGLGIGRTVAAAVEQNHDADGIIWPRPLAPFEVLLIALNTNDEEVARAAEGIYEQLRERGVEVLFDDRNERPGVKFKDADLIGVPVRLVVGARSLAEGQVEASLRADREKTMVAVADAAATAVSMLEGLSAG